MIFFRGTREDSQAGNRCLALVLEFVTTNNARVGARLAEEYLFGLLVLSDVRVVAIALVSEKLHRGVYDQKSIL